MPAKSKAQQRFMGLVHALNKGDVDPSKVSKKVKDVAKDMDKSDVKKYASTKHKGKPEKVKQEDINLETLIKENPAAIAAAVQTMQKMKAKNPKTGRVNKLSTALGDKQHPAHKKAKSVFSRIVDKFKKKKDGPNPTSKDSPLVPKKQSKADVDFYKKQFTGETINKLKEMIRVELEGCGYTTSAVDPNIKLKSPGGTGEEDKDLKEGMKTAGDVPFGNFNFNTAGKNSIKKLAKRYGLKVKKITKGPNYEPTAVLQGDEKKLMKFLMSKDYGVDKFSAEDMIEGKLHEGEKEKIEQLLIKYGNTPEDAKQMVRKTYDYIKKAYRNANASKKAEIMSSLMKFETTEQFSNLVEKCWKGYMIHPKRKTKKLFGKTYPNCIKKENISSKSIMSEMDYRGFIKYMNDFYGPKGVYPDKKKRTLKMKDIGLAYSVLLKKKPNFEIGYDSTDREMLRDILIKMKKLDPDYTKKEYMNTMAKKRKRKGLAPIEGFASAAQRRAAFASGYKAKGKKKKKEVAEAVKVLKFTKVKDNTLEKHLKFISKKVGAELSKIDGGFRVDADGDIRKLTSVVDYVFDKSIKKGLMKGGGMSQINLVKEAMDKRQGAETLKQLGGNRFIMMTGAKHFGVGPNGMSFKIGKNSKRVNHVTIDYDRGRDLYNMKFDWVTIKGIKNKKTLKGIYADQLQDMFTRYTGMYTSL
tara:strand:- start:22 stop:2103 length:2082 start_codon:yes stop_codon:yes gene_type:complete